MKLPKITYDQLCQLRTHIHDAYCVALGKDDMGNIPDQLQSMLLEVRSMVQASMPPQLSGRELRGALERRDALCAAHDTIAERPEHDALAQEISAAITDVERTIKTHLEGNSK